MVRPIRWRDDALELLDQRRLPGAEVWVRCETVEAVAHAIETLAVRGAPAIGIAAAYGLVLGMRAPLGADPGLRLEESIRRLSRTRPTAVNLAWALEQGRHALEAHRWTTTAEAAAGLHELADALLRGQAEADRTLGRHGAVLFAPGDRVLTHCNAGALATGGSGTAGSVIATAWDMGRLQMVWVDETRPLLQGARLTAWELDQAGVPFRLVTDSTSGLLMASGRVDRVIVGADRIAANGDVANKIGTYPLAVLAHRHEVPFIVAAPLSTIDIGTASGAGIPLEQRDPSEITALNGTAVAPAGTAAENWAFDVTPNELVSAIVTEAGVLEPPLEVAIARACALGTAIRTGP